MTDLGGPQACTVPGRAVVYVYYLVARDLLRVSVHARARGRCQRPFSASFLGRFLRHFSAVSGSLTTRNMCVL
jgi:hypothetical protein